MTGVSPDITTKVVFTLLGMLLIFLIGYVFKTHGKDKILALENEQKNLLKIIDNKEWESLDRDNVINKRLDHMDGAIEEIEECLKNNAEDKHTQKETMVDGFNKLGNELREKLSEVKSDIRIIKKLCLNDNDDN